MPTNITKTTKFHESILENIGSYFNVKAKTLASILVFIFNNTIFFPLLSMSLFIVYMLKHGFFSYDFFTSGLFGMKVFTYTLVIFLLLLSFLTFGSLSLFILKNKEVVDPVTVDNEKLIEITENKESKEFINKKTIWFIAIINVLMITILAVSIFHLGFSIEKFYFFAILLILLIYLAIHIGYVLSGKAKEQIRAAIILAGVTIILLMLAHDHVTIMLGSTLRAFGSGGDLQMEVINNKQVTKGRLIFLGPENIYYKTSDNSLVIQDIKGLEIHIFHNGNTHIKNN